MGALSIRQVRKSYGAHEILKSIDIDVEKGEFLILVGPSGCGKSTLLRMVAGLETISAGEIAIGGAILAAEAARLGLIDEKGVFIDQLQTFALLCYYLLEYRGQRGPLVRSVTMIIPGRIGIRALSKAAQWSMAPSAIGGVLASM